MGWYSSLYEIICSYRLDLMVPKQWHNRYLESKYFHFANICWKSKYFSTTKNTWKCQGTAKENTVFVQTNAGRCKLDQETDLLPGTYWGHSAMSDSLETSTGFPVILPWPVTHRKGLFHYLLFGPFHQLLARTRGWQSNREWLFSKRERERKATCFSSWGHGMRRKILKNPVWLTSYLSLLGWLLSLFWYFVGVKELS